MGRKHKRFCTTLKYIEHVLILASAITEYISISAFGSLIGIPMVIASSPIGLKICSITAGIKKYKSIIKKKKKKVLTTEALIDSYISHDEFVLINNIHMTIWEKKFKNWKC